MFYIVESDYQIKNLQGYCSHGCYIEVVPDNFNLHPHLNNVVGVYIRPIDLDQGFIIPINHSEGLNISKESISEVINNLCSTYTLDKKDLLYYFNPKSVTDISLLYSMTYFERLEVPNPLDSFSWFYKKYGIKETNKIIPLPLLYQFYEERFNKIKDSINLEEPSGFDFYNNLGTEVFHKIEKNGIKIKPEFLTNFTPRNPRFNINKSKVYTKYNLYNITSRPTNSFNSVNFAAIPKTENHRNSFIPENDKFIEFDFDGYHVRLLCELLDYPLTQESAHKQLAKQYFDQEEISDSLYQEAKQINFQAVYGKIPEGFADIEIFRKITKFIEDLWAEYQKTGRVLAPISKKPFTTALKDMYPQKLMNYIMQSLETSRNILILSKVLNLLEGKKTKVVLYTYDAILFDYSKEDGKELLTQLEDILSESDKYPVGYKSSDFMVL